MNILVTGSNRGLGLALVQKGVERGHTMIAAVRSPHSKLRELKELINQHPDQVRLLYLDVTSEKSLNEGKKEVQNWGIHLDSIVNSAGIFISRESELENLNFDEAIVAFEVNSIGPMRVVKHFFPLLSGRNRSCINISSEQGSISNASRGDYFYGMSKAALNMFSEKLKKGYPDLNVLSIHPGSIQKPFSGYRVNSEITDVADEILNWIEGTKPFDTHHTYYDYKGQSIMF
ncbi:hypothetical protein AJ85_01105 [Alkalihalobacillus alcalophilus ATCC 27647 = CGMCC 1.3604]|uniref:Short-chain dehydrogenase n=1 Tax=Alkalihalobacillus alcalophilus ATCC 27647 = CGMCC 1.3604 TaxID=1218173 RepID=A0A094XBB1_ALKAL|nr:SDR family NAD(P)-dependent oxidoreductase [Alkalihalobacillus alcalophilus]KGA96095.1 hypothetical protein BALCAV_0218435 [Alkalihalobacillus alcalophilus ATCC 27647 = CGMCC 1.3604]MED1561072.1 SDR family NAD(P)-dependent oxidoreductase [Alkalihalobacillus alcalophilus]THG88678.1 hypothetical protein AJ85_01105 [Alkalihalobacillus alcalophilus ATCC 27647 = CGMCC 1.3604]